MIRRPQIQRETQLANKLREARENAREQVVIGSIFSQYPLRGWSDKRKSETQLIADFEPIVFAVTYNCYSGNYSPVFLAYFHFHLRQPEVPTTLKISF